MLSALFALLDLRNAVKSRKLSHTLLKIHPVNSESNYEYNNCTNNIKGLAKHV